MEMKFQTNLNCGSCVSKVRPFLDAEPTIEKWEVDTQDERKVLTVFGDRLQADTIAAAVALSGFKVLAPLSEKPIQLPAPATRSGVSQFKPLILIFTFLILATALQERDGFNYARAMENFMGGFFLVFSFFKFLDIPKFAQAYSTYDLVAQKWPGYGLVYPFVELVLGLLYLSHTAGPITNAATLGLMLLGSLGVLQALRQKRTIECACLGTVFNLPMTKVTLFEDLLMALMALLMLL